MSPLQATIKRLSTGVPGLDEVLCGGLPEFSFNLLAGPPGAGKTTLAHQMMFALATAERPALYFTVPGEPPLKMLRYQQQFEFFDLDKLNRTVRFINLSDEIADGDLTAVLKRIVAEVEQRTPGLVLIDSFRSVLIAGQSQPNPRLSVQQFTQDLGVTMTSWQATTFLIGEYFNEGDPDPIFTVADGVIWLRQSAQRNSVVRKLEIVKMRGQPTLSGLHTFRIGSDGIRVFPPAEAFARTQIAIPSSSDERLGVGVPGLDAMLGGGLPRGYSMLVAGPSGSGKSIMASAFLAEGERVGTSGVIASFEQRPNLARSRVVADLIDRGSVGLVDTRAADLSVDEIAAQILTEIHRLGATRVVIDSLTGFELKMAPTFREDFRESLARMVAVLAGTGVTMLMTSELEDRYSDLRFSPYGTAFLTDAIIVQRYIEVDSRLQRVMAVVKLRASAHSNGLQLYEIDNGGIRLGGMLHDYEGLLGGRPTRRDPLFEPTLTVSNS